MCGRFYVPEDDLEETIVRVIERADERAQRLGAGKVARGEVFPTQTVAALAPSRQGRPEAFPMRWGYQLGGGKQLINTRSETAAEKPLFRDSFARRRCLIPAAWYYEWQHTGPERARYALRPGWGGPVWLMGIYRFEPGLKLPALSILTRAAALEISFIHDRMPVICPPDRIGEWLDPARDAGEMTRLAQPMTCSKGDFHV